MGSAYARMPSRDWWACLLQSSTTASAPKLAIREMCISSIKIAVVILCPQGDAHAKRAKLSITWAAITRLHVHIQARYQHWRNTGRVNHSGTAFTKRLVLAGFLTCCKLPTLLKPKTKPRCYRKRLFLFSFLRTLLNTLQAPAYDSELVLDEEKQVEIVMTV